MLNILIYLLTYSRLKVILTLIGPLLLPKVIRCYQAPRNPYSMHVRPVPLAVIPALIILLASATYFLTQTLPYFSPEEIFSLTNSRLQIPNDILFTRLSAIRPAGLTETDKILKSKMSSLENRLLYLQHGPFTIAYCTFCNPEDPNSYFYFSIPTLLFPHLLNLFILGVTTSSFFTGQDGNAWRSQVSMAAVGLSALDLYFIFSYAHRSNVKAKVLGELDFFFWNARIYRLFSLTLLDLIFGCVLYLSSTNRAFSRTPFATERLENLNNALDEVLSKITGTGIVHNTVARDRDLSFISQQYWTHEVRMSREIMEEKEVIENITRALESRINISAIERDADNYTQMVTAPFYEQIGETPEV